MPKKALQLDIFSLVTETLPVDQAPAIELHPMQKEEQRHFSAKECERKQVELQFLSYLISPCGWSTRFDSPEERAAKYTDAIYSLHSVRKRLEELIQESRERPRPALSGAWREMGERLKELYCNYSGEGGLRISVDLIRAQLNFLRERMPPAAQRRLLLSGIRALLSSAAHPDMAAVAEALQSDLNHLCSTDISAAEVEHFLDRLATLEKQTEGGLIPPKGRKLNSDEGHGAYFSPEHFQHLLRLLQLSAIGGREINVLEPNVGKGVLIRPVANHPGFLTLGYDLNPLSAEIAEITSWIDPNAAAQACTEGHSPPLGRRCGILRGHAFDLHNLIPNGLFDLLLANPPFVYDTPKKEMEKAFRSLGLPKQPDGFSLTAYTRQILPLKLREGGLSLLITSARARNFKRTRHANGHVSHPILILALSGQPFAEQDAELVPVSLAAYRFNGESILDKEHTEAQCFITLSVYLSPREAHGKQAAWSESEILALDYRDLPRLVDLVLQADRWTPLERQLLGPSVRMIQLANLLRLYTQIRATILARLDLKQQMAKRSFRIEDAERFRKMREEAAAKRFQQIGSIGDLQSWLTELESRWGFPLQEEISLQLRNNPLRDLFSNKRGVRSDSSVIEAVLRQAFNAILAVSDRFYSRFYLLSAIMPTVAQRELTTLYGPFNGVVFDTRHPLLSTVPYPFSLYLLNGRELLRLIERFPEEEQREVIAIIARRRWCLIRSVPRFNEYAESATMALTESLGGAWRDALYHGSVPPASKTKSLGKSENLLVREIGRLLLHIAQQNPENMKQVNEALAVIDPIGAQERYYHYLRQFPAASISERRICNLIEKTEGLIETLEQAEAAMRNSAPSVKRKIRPTSGPK